ncbi:hypothetical protein J2W42_001953 [Rhizobium tibeticum]|uniref:Uncharacterized protein n=1 Tax=Rhizobium tibeticum TaxID=501024 RepID=A0A1H8NFV0_9HYPH|nr:hypothetical protein [Rhizobium tibeticum]SEH95400.1 hypothetical protein RTCCBAU85039_3288 [Rhizobium tibeticum]SEO28500.1 hypothetical protein SAMN05216228_1014123 [Rhizobium tibeticum]
MELVRHALPSRDRSHRNIDAVLRIEAEGAKTPKQRRSGTESGKDTVPAVHPYLSSSV